MRDNRFLGLVAGACFLTAAALVACASDEDPATGSSGSGGGTSGTGGTGGSAGQAGSAGTAGTGGTGGSAGTAGSGGTAGTGGGELDGGAGMGGAGGTGVAGDHVLLSEIGILANDAEFIELWNPTDQAVDLSNYFISDNAAYYTITSGPWNPDQTAGTDFVAQFPSGTSIPAGGVIVVGANPLGYEAVFGGCPDFFLEATGQAVSCGGANVPAMLVPANGSVGDQAGKLLSNDREMIVLFQWDGSSATVKDVDYVTWGDQFIDASRIDKTGVSGYQNDTARGSQTGADAVFEMEGGAPEAGPTAARSIERCDAMEPGEVLTGGNGLTGHDETSENFASSFTKQEVPTPGVKNSCL